MRKPTAMIPATATADEDAEQGGLRTRRSRTISGSDSATVPIMNARTVPVGTPLCPAPRAIGMTPAALEYSGMPDHDGDGTAKGCPARRRWRRSPRGPAVDARARRRSRRAGRARLAQDVAVSSGAIWIRSSHVSAGGGVEDLAALGWSEDERLDPPLEAAAGRGDTRRRRRSSGPRRRSERSAGPEGAGTSMTTATSLTSGRGDEEGHRDPERDPGGDEADEDRDRACTSRTG